MKIVSPGNLITVLTKLCRKHNEFAEAVGGTFDEVYKNLEALEGKLEGCSYTEATETLTVPGTRGMVNGETLILK